MKSDNGHNIRMYYKVTNNNSDELCKLCEKLLETRATFGSENEKSDVISDLEKEFKTLSDCEPPIPV